MPLTEVVTVPLAPSLSSRRTTTSCPECSLRVSSTQVSTAGLSCSAVKSSAEGSGTMGGRAMELATSSGSGFSSSEACISSTVIG
ncbi:hypothetical protein D3C75_816140 [compost metagenome]